MKGKKCRYVEKAYKAYVDKNDNGCAADNAYNVLRYRCQACRYNDS